MGEQETCCRRGFNIDLRNLLSEETIKQSDFIYCGIGGSKAARVQNGFAATGFHATIAGDCAQSNR
jgi:hypothetical protein